MGSYLDLLSATAKVVGGTQPTLAQMQAGANGIGQDQDPAVKLATQTAQQPFWFSGSDVGDGSGVTGIVGCYSLPCEVWGSLPVGMVIPHQWMPLEAQPFQGSKDRLDDYRVRVLVGNGSLEVLMAQLVDYSDSVPAAFDTHAQLFASMGVGYGDCSRGIFLELNWGGKVYLALEFTLTIYRSIPTIRTP
ncbi:MAG: hypothetical protein ACRETG_04625 [Steroidobacteraceae bacterium]